MKSADEEDPERHQSSSQEGDAGVRAAAVAAQLASIGEFERRIAAWDERLGDSEPATVFRVPKEIADGR